MSTSAALFKVTIKVRPSLAHPKYYAWQFGFLSVWLYVESDLLHEVDDTPAQRAIRIVEELPYEIVGRQVSVRTGKATYAGYDCGGGAAEAHCEQLGFALVLGVLSAWRR